jgi:hypothetical protein
MNNKKNYSLQFSSAKKKKQIIIKEYNKKRRSKTAYKSYIIYSQDLIMTIQ